MSTNYWSVWVDHNYHQWNCCEENSLISEQTHGKAPVLIKKNWVQIYVVLFRKPFCKKKAKIKNPTVTKFYHKYHWIV